MWVRLQLDVSWRDLFCGFAHLFWPHDRALLTQRIEKRWSAEGNAIAVLSVRSGLDLLLRTMEWPAGSEVVYSALNIPDMSLVARQNGIVPVPADLDVERLAPDLQRIERAITPRTKAIVVAHLYGNFVPMEPICALARRHNLMVIEDCAEIYDGVYTGHPEADVSLFSFGPLKTATALAGGVLRTKDASLCARLRAQHESLSKQSRMNHFKRVCKYGTLKFFGSRWIYGVVRRGIKLVIGDVDKLIHHTAKSFKNDLSALRCRPSTPLLALMARRFRRFDHERLRRRTANGKYLADLLRGHIFCPGADVEPHNYWLFPIVVNDPRHTLAALESEGFDASLVESMRAVEAPAGRPDLTPTQTLETLPHIVLLPCYPSLPEAELKRMADVIIAAEKEHAERAATTEHVLVDAAHS